jgi:hypothetical protein
MKDKIFSILKALVPIVAGLEGAKGHPELAQFITTAEAGAEQVVSELQQQAANDPNSDVTADEVRAQFLALKEQALTLGDAAEADVAARHQGDAPPADPDGAQGSGGQS